MSIWPAGNCRSGTSVTIAAPKGPVDWKALEDPLFPSREMLWMAIRWGPIVGGIFGLLTWAFAGDPTPLWLWLLWPVSIALRHGRHALEHDGQNTDQARRPWTKTEAGTQFGSEGESVTFTGHDVIVQHAGQTLELSWDRVNDVRIRVPHMPWGAGMATAVLRERGLLHRTVHLSMWVTSEGRTHTFALPETRVYDWRLDFTIKEAARELGPRDALTRAWLLDDLYETVSEGSVLGYPISRVRVPLLDFLLGGKGGYNAAMKDYQRRIANLPEEEFSLRSTLVTLGSMVLVVAAVILLVEWLT